MRTQREWAEREAETRREAEEAAERRHQQALEAAEAHKKFLEDQERERQELEDDREAERQEHAERLETERQEHAERLEAERKAHQESLAERQRRTIFHSTLRQSRYGKAWDDLEIAIGQRSHDPASAETALRSAVTQWPGYAWAWLELAEVLRERGVPADRELERACASALSEGVWKLAPPQAPSLLSRFASALGATVSSAPAKQAWFLSRFVQLAPAGTIRRLLEGSPRFYPLLSGPPSGWMDPDYDAPLGDLSSVARVDDVAMMLTASCSAEALEHLIAAASKNARIRSSIARGHILSPYGDDRVIFEWCSAWRRDDLATAWIELALRHRLRGLEQTLSGCFPDALDLFLASCDPSTGLTPSVAARRKTELTANLAAIEGASQWERLFEAKMAERSAVFGSIQSVIPATLRGARAALAAAQDRDGRECAETRAEGRRAYDARHRLLSAEAAQVSDAVSAQRARWAEQVARPLGRDLPALADLGALSAAPSLLASINAGYEALVRDDLALRRWLWSESDSIIAAANEVGAKVDAQQRELAVVKRKCSKASEALRSVPFDLMSTIIGWAATVTMWFIGAGLVRSDCLFDRGPIAGLGVCGIVRGFGLYSIWHPVALLLPLPAFAAVQAVLSARRRHFDAQLRDVTTESAPLEAEQSALIGALTSQRDAVVRTRGAIGSESPTSAPWGESTAVLETVAACASVLATRGRAEACLRTTLPIDDFRPPPAMLHVLAMGVAAMGLFAIVANAARSPAYDRTLEERIAATSPVTAEHTTTAAALQSQRAAAATEAAPATAMAAAPPPAPTPPTPTYQAPSPSPAPAEVPMWGLGPRPSTARASSAFHRGRERHPATDAFDGDLATAWNDGVEGDGRGEWLEAHFDDRQPISGFRITLGFEHISRHGHDLFTDNARIRTLRVTADGRELGVWSAFDGQRDLVVGGLNASARDYRFEVVDVWPGARFQDVCVSEVAFVAGVEHHQTRTHRR